MAKIGLTKLQLKKNTNLIQLNWNDQVIEIKEYLPIEEKSKLIEKIVNQSLDDNNFANPLRIYVNTVLEVIFAYTNINFTDKQKEDKQVLYDLLVSSKLWENIRKLMIENTIELQEIEVAVREIINEVYKYKTSALGILQAVTADYSNLELDAEKLKGQIADKDNLKLLNDVMEKLG